MRRSLLALLVVPVALAASGCESTQEKSAKLAAKGANAIKDEKGLTISRRATGVKVGATAVLQDENGAAVVAELSNTSAEPLRDVPIALTVKGAGGKAVYKNDVPGLDHSLTSISLLPAHSTVLWVNDQIELDGAGKRVAVVVGAPHGKAPGAAPDLKLSAPSVTNDPTSGVEAKAALTNDSKVEQRNVVVLGVARRGSKIVAAGRAVVPRVKPGKKAKFSLFFIGNPTGARVTLAAPPTTFQ